MAKKLDENFDLGNGSKQILKIKFARGCGCWKWRSVKSPNVKISNSVFVNRNFFLKRENFYNFIRVSRNS